MERSHTKKINQPPLPGLKKPARPAPAGPRILPDWLRQKIEAENPNAFGRHATWKICRCGAVTLQGWDAYDDYAGHAILDPRQLNNRQELDARLQQRETFELRTDREGRHTISRRDQYRILASPASTHRWPVLPEHRCGAPPIGSKLEPRKPSGK